MRSSSRRGAGRTVAIGATGQHRDGDDPDRSVPDSEAVRRGRLSESAEFRGRINSPENMLEYVIIPPSRFDAVIDHLRVNFPDEPLNASVGLCLHGTPCPLLEYHDLKTMEDGLSVMAVDKHDEKIAGVALNGISKKGDTEKSIEEMKSIEHLQYRRIFGLLNDVNLELDLFSKYHVDKIFEVRILSVDSNYRGKGIAKELFAQSEAVARKNGFKIMKTDATSLFTQKVAESQGFWVEKSVNYHDYKDGHGQKIYDTRPPHLHYKVMAKLLE